MKHYRILLSCLILPVLVLAQPAPSDKAVLKLSWTDNSTNETGFIVQRSLDGVAFTEVARPAANVVEYTDTNLAHNTRYHYRVAAFNAAGTSGYTAVVSAVTMPPPPTTPSTPTLEPLPARP